MLRFDVFLRPLFDDHEDLLYDYHTLWCLAYLSKNLHDTPRKIDHRISITRKMISVPVIFVIRCVLNSLRCKPSNAWAKVDSDFLSFKFDLDAGISRRRISGKERSFFLDGLFTTGSLLFGSFLIDWARMLFASDQYRLERSFTLMSRFRMQLVKHLGTKTFRCNMLRIDEYSLKLSNCSSVSRTFEPSLWPGDDPRTT